MDFMPTRTDAYPTKSSQEQGATERELDKHRPLTGQPPPSLQRNTHLQFLVRNLIQGFPARFVSLDASHPWLAYWTIQSFYTFGAALDPDNKQRCIDTIMACQYPEGGFGGGPGQFPHLLPTYAAVSALAAVGRPGPRGGWDQIDREKLYKFFMSLKQPDGSFLVARDQEVDVRGIYCLLSVATLLNLLTPELIAGTPAFIASLQTYEGGFASASHPFYSPSTNLDGSRTVLTSPHPALGEAHGGYTFCALASWVMLRPFLGLERDRPKINIKNLTRWCVQMQGSESELGGFRGRTNKLVDGCYSWWVGGCFALLRGLGVGVAIPTPLHPENISKENSDEWTDVDDTLFNRVGLQQYILCAGQHPNGGLRDKPPKSSDAYHTLYTLAGLSSAQHRVSQSPELQAKFTSEWKSTGAPEHLEDMRCTAFVEARSWKEEEGGSEYINGAADRVNASHPVFNLTMTHVREAMIHFYKQK